MNTDEHRIRELESELQRVRLESKHFRDATFALLGQLVPYRPITDDELHELLADTSGQPIRDLIAELEHKPA